jgi:hypothetical protein
VTFPGMIPSGCCVAIVPEIIPDGLETYLGGSDQDRAQLPSLRLSQRFEIRYQIGDILRIQMLQPTVPRIANHFG